MNNNDLKKINIFIFLLLFFTIISGYYLNEDSLGGAKNDFFHHLPIAQSFNINFNETWNKFGIDPGTRNSPVFWVFVSYLIKFISIDLFRFLNIFIAPLIVIVFYKCLLIKFKNYNRNLLFLIACTVYLSPTIRSLTIWPYSLIWGILFFLISIYYFLLFLENSNKNQKFKFSILSSFFLIFAAYIFPSFAVFYFFLFIKFFQELDIKKIINLLIFCAMISLPAFYYFISKDIYSAFKRAEGIKNLDGLTDFNLSNKIIIITTIYLYLLIPFLDFQKILINLKKNINFRTLFFLTFFAIINIYYFNYPYFDGGGFGGGFFHKLSYILFNNYYFLYIVFFISLIIFYIVLEKNYENFLLFVLTIFSNPQFTIYNKYFDPIIIILFFLLFKIDMKKYFFNQKYKLIKLYILLTLYLVISLSKKYFI